MKKKWIALVIVIAAALSMIPIIGNAYTANTSSKSLVLHYNFDSSEDGVINDVSGHGNNGSIDSVALIEGSGICGNYLSLDGYTAVKLPDKILNGMEEVTISTWVNFRYDDSSMEEWQRIFDLGSYTDNNLFLSKNRQVEMKTETALDSITGDQILPNDEWVYIALTIGNGKMKYYENGIVTKVNEAIVNSLSAYWEGTENYIGKSKYQADPLLKADIDEFKIYNRALDEKTIKENMYDDMSDEALLNRVADTLEIQSIDNVYKDIELPKKIDNIAEIEWTSSNPDFIDNTGKVKRPESGKAVEITLTAKISNKGTAINKSFNVYVLPVGVSSYILNVNADEKLFDVSDMLSGLFFEDINHGADGGLYSELIENRSFQYTSSLDAWEITSDNNSEVTIEVNNPLNKNNDKYVQIYTAEDNKSVEIYNDGYKGITVKADESYDFSMWARNVESNNNIYVEIQDENGKAISDEVEIKVNSNEWEKYSEKMKVNKNTSSAKFVVYTKKKGIVDLDMISLLPEENVNEYGLRMDLIERMEELKPTFIRFPGGCVLEGHNKDQMYNWKNTIGNIEERKEVENIWGYSQSYGLGFYEYFLLCEDLKAEPVPILNCGMSCQAGIHNGKSEWMAQIGDELDSFIQDALDLIEYCNGDGTGEWSKKRVASGHSEPFNLKYLGIGNEQWGNDYHERFEAFQKVINEKYPEIVLISAAGPIAEGALYDDAWRWIKEEGSNTIVDEHYYMNPEWFTSNTDRYDSFDRNGPKVFIGEYASKSNTLKSAIAEAAFFTGIEKNSDIVKMTSYAPLFAKEDDYQWSPDMIWFNGDSNYGSANFYTQKLMSTNLGTKMLKDELVRTVEHYRGINNDVFTSSSFDEESGELIIKIVNTSEESKEITININGSYNISRNANIQYLTSDNLEDVNSFKEPEKVSIKTKTIDNVSNRFIYDIGKNSADVIRIKVK